MASAWSAIPGETPIDDLSGLQVAGVTTRADLNRCEFANIAEAITRYLAARPSKRLAPFNLPWCKKLHRDMFGNVWTWAGKLRQSETDLGAPPHLIEPKLHDLMADLPYWASRPMVEQAAELHYRAVCIHPFNNGNGRWSRLLANIWLRQHKHPLIEWPEPGLGEESSPLREEYLAAVRQADAGDLAALIELHQRFVAAK